MAKNINKVKEVDVATVAGNKTLAATVARRSVERCKEAIEKLGVVHTPVVGATKDGRHLLLSGQCELTALRELGIKRMDAIEVDMTGEGIVNAKLSLLLISLRDRPGALCEGLLLQEAVSAGVPRSEIQSMLGKSASWVSNRLSLVTRLDINVYEMVKCGLLEARSAEEIARLPIGDQFAFADMAVREGLPKSAIEPLVCAYNDERCPDEVKAQIFEDPREALKRLADKRRAVNAGRREQRDVPDIIDGYIKSMKFQTIALGRTLSDISQDKALQHVGALKELESILQALLAMIQAFFTRVKMGVDHSG